jgi:hypothetical protein
MAEWKDPRVELPDPGVRCEIQCQDRFGKYSTTGAYVYREGFWFTADTRVTVVVKVVGWRLHP